MANIDALDPKAIKRLRDLTSPGEVRKLVQAAMENIAEQLATARQALVLGDVETASKALHSLLPSAGNVGATHVEDLARQGIGVAARSARDPTEVRKRTAALTALVASLEDAWSQARPLLEGVQHESDPQDRRPDRRQRR